MANYVTWNDLIQFMLMLISGTSLLYMIFHNNKKN